jgi:hypothetical protein
MLVALLFPFTDVRAFVEGRVIQQVGLPTWGNLDPSRDFVRAVGPIRSRRRGSVQEWPEEDAYCRVSSALRLDPRYQEVTEPELAAVPLRRYCAFRRFWADGHFDEWNVVARLELGFGYRDRSKARQQPAAEQCLQCVEATLKLPVTLRGAGAARTAPLIEVRDWFGKLYLRSTSVRNRGQWPPVEPWWFRPGLPLGLVEFPAGKSGLLPAMARRVPALADRGIDLSFVRIECAGIPVGVWLVGIHAGMKDRDLLRRLRINLFRLHAERQSLSEILRLVRQKKLKPVIQLPPDLPSPPTDRLQDYLREAVNYLRRETRDGLPQSEILRVSQEAGDFALPGEREKLLAELGKIRPALLRKVSGYLDREATPPEAVPPRQGKVFISHSSADKPFVRRLVQELEKRRLNVWFDEQELKVGDSIVANVSAGLRDSHYLIVVLSRASVASRWVQEELNAALMEDLSGEGQAVLPVLLEDCDVPPLLRSRLYADFRTDFAAGLKKLLAVLTQESESANQATPGSGTVSATPCTTTLSALPLADLRRRITKRMSRSEVGVIWYDFVGRKMDDDMANRPLVDCVIELIDRAKNRNQLPEMIAGICAERPDLAAPQP